MVSQNEQQKPLSESLITLFATVAPSMWATSFLAVKYVVQIIPPFTAAAFRFVLVIIILWTLLLILRVHGPRRPTLRDTPLVAATGLCQTTFYFAFQYWGLRLTTASNGAVLGNTRPIFVTLLAALFLHEAFTRRKASGIGLAFVGVMFIIGPDSLPIARSTTEQLIGNVALLLSSVSGAIGLVLTKRVVARFGPLPSLVYTNSFGALGLLVLAAIELTRIGGAAPYTSHPLAGSGLPGGVHHDPGPYPMEHGPLPKKRLLGGGLPLHYSCDDRPAELALLGRTTDLEPARWSRARLPGHLPGYEEQFTHERRAKPYINTEN